MHHLEPILSFAGQHAGLAYLTVFLASLAESLTLAGLAVPGSILLFAFAALAGTGHLALAPVFLLALAGAMAADGCNYRLGLRYRKQLRQPWFFSQHPQILGDADAFLLRHGEKGIILARFAGLIHPLITLRAGMQHMPASRFLAVSLVSAICWTGTHILAGLFFGILLSMAGVVSGRLALLLMLVILSLWSFFWLCRRILFIAAVFGKKWLIDLRHWAQQARPSSHGPVRFLQRLLAAMFALGHRAEVLTLFLGTMVLAAGSGFAVVVQDVLAKDTLVLVDQSFFHFMQGLRSYWTDSFFVAITELGDSFVTTTLVIVILLALLALRLWRSAIFWLLNAVGGSIGMQALKWTFQQPRPTDLYEGISSYSFPSGHTTMSVVIYGFLAIILARNLAGIRQWLLFSAVLVIAFFIGFSRLYLGAHWFSDVLAGSLIGTSWAALLGLAWLQGAPERIPCRLLVLTVLAVHCTAGARHILQRHGQDLELYAPRLIEKRTDLAVWQQSGWQDLPGTRQDSWLDTRLRPGSIPAQPMTLQWAGRPEDIRQVLMQRGWQEPAPFEPEMLLRLFAPRVPVAQLPLLPRLHEGKRESFIMVRQQGDSRLVLRLWDGATSLSPLNIPLFTGFIEEQQSRTFGRMRSFPVESGNYRKRRQVLAQLLPDGLQDSQTAATDTAAVQVAEKTRNGRMVNQNAIYQQGTVLLLWPGQER